MGRDAIAVSYTSGTTATQGRGHAPPRCAYLNAVCNAATWTMPHFPRSPVDAADVPLQRLVLPWTVAMLGGTCLPARRRRRRSSPRCASTASTTTAAAPIVHNLVDQRAAEWRAASPVRGMVGRRRAAGGDDRGHGGDRLRHHHVYGLTEVYGPAAVAVKRDAGRPRACPSRRLNGRQGVRYPLQEGMTVMDPATMTEVPPTADDGRDHVPRQHRDEGLPEEPEGHAEAFAGGWFHTGDLAVMSPTAT